MFDWLMPIHNAGDLNETYFVGNVDDESRRLVQCTYECLDKAISIGIYPINFNHGLKYLCNPSS